MPCDNRGMKYAHHEPAAASSAALKPFLILSHGLESGPDATKVSALARVADEFGLQSVRPDYRDLDASRDVARIGERIARVVQHAPEGAPVILAGSSMGAFTSAFASLQTNCIGLFLIALPLRIEGYARQFEAARVPTALVHGWDDELCPVEDAITFARTRGDAITLVRDEHRLAAHVDFCAEQFRLFLGQFA